MPSILDTHSHLIVVVPSGCWVWVGGANHAGYGHGWYAGKHHRMHRLAYIIEVGPIPEGQELDHLCRQRNCCNPAHLEPVTHAVNARRGEAGVNNRVKTHCPRGHEYTQENTRVWRGRRFCIACDRLRRRR